MPEKRRGRPLSAEVHNAILGAARDLLVAVGYEKLTIDGIATQAKVGRQAVYRRWATKSEIVSAAVLEGYLMADFGRPPDTGDLAVDLREWLRSLFVNLSDPAQLALSRGLTAAAAESAELTGMMYGTLTGPLREVIADRLRSAVRQGAIRADAEIEATVDAVIGTMTYRILVRRAGLEPDAGDELVAVLVNGLRK